MVRRYQKPFKEKFVAEREAYPPLKALNENQALYMDALEHSPQTIVTGCAGTGKSFICSTVAADLLRKGEKRKIVLTRPNVPSGKTLGLFPGSLEEKFSEWVRPFTDVIKTRMSHGAYEIAVKNRDIEMVPFEVMRGRTFDNSFIILDEAQNTTPTEMKMFLTRIGRDSTVVINGDIDQTDLKETSGLKTILSMVKKYGLPVPVIEFTMDDIVRSGICELWIKAFHKEGV